jgi:hypothetical protein
MIECSLINLIPDIGCTVVPLNWFSFGLTTLEVRVVSNHPSSPVVTVVFYHVLEVFCYHSFWAVKSRLCLRLFTLGSITCKYLQVFR